MESTPNSGRLHFPSLGNNPPANPPRPLRLLSLDRPISHRASHLLRLPHQPDPSSDSHRKMESIRNRYLRSGTGTAWEGVSQGAKMGEDQEYQGDCGVLLYLEEN
mmetsp:Transcript_21061/g.42460  ORF Transcript_21061/g.42460 Transcript_21061/m.42460 type:complete len:105 (-) Transcript_21061:293-607(-)